MAKHTMTSEEYKLILTKLNIGHASRTAAVLIGKSVRQSQRYADGTPIPETVAMLLRLYATKRRITWPKSI